jgi:hypothetical protein
MTTCDNCSKEAAYTCADPGVNPVNYCVDCLPVWLQAQAEAGHFPLVQEAVVAEKSTVEEAPKPSKKKKKAAPSNADSN